MTLSGVNENEHNSGDLKTSSYECNNDNEKGKTNNKPTNQPLAKVRHPKGL